MSRQDAGPSLFTYTTLFRSERTPALDQERVSGLRLLGTGARPALVLVRDAPGALRDVRRRRDDRRAGKKVALSVAAQARSEEHTPELQSRLQLVCRLLLEKK